MTAPALPVEIVRLTADDWRAHRDLRLASLLDSPDAFGTTHAENAGFDEATWRSRLEAVTYWQARAVGEPVGMVGLWEVVDDDFEVAGVAGPVPFLISMFVRPRARGQQVGAALGRVVLDEARARGHEAVVLDVTSGNEAARRLYARLGFVFTGQSFPHPRRECLAEDQMVCRLG